MDSLKSLESGSPKIRQHTGFREGGPTVHVHWILYIVFNRSQPHRQRCPGGGSTPLTPPACPGMLSSDEIETAYTLRVIN